MKLSAMRFKNYVWPHNPRVYEIEYRKDVTSHRVPFGLYVLQNMGRQNRVLKGEGAFAGEGAYAEFKKLASVFFDMTPGILTHPLWDAASACFVALRLKQEPTENYVAYSFEFWECYDGYNTGLTVIQTASSDGNAAAVVKNTAEYYTVVHGDYLWAIARDHGLTLAELLALNPQIRNSNVIYTGDRIRVK